MSTLAWITAGGAAMSLLAALGQHHPAPAGGGVRQGRPALGGARGGHAHGWSAVAHAPWCRRGDGQRPPGVRLASRRLPDLLRARAVLALAPLPPADAAAWALGYLILIADGLHNFIGGLSVGGAFLVDVRLGLVTWAVAASHEVPQELGDFGILIQAGWSNPRALLFKRRVCPHDATAA